MFSKNVVKPDTEATLGKAADHAPSILSAGLTIDGDLSSEGELQIDCVIRGNVTASAVVIGAQGSVTGDVTAQDVTILGHVYGDIKAGDIHCSNGSRISGNVHYRSINVEPGARIAISLTPAGAA
jgi:cytoskeletal protein CcmA (bactofilin family)